MTARILRHELRGLLSDRLLWIATVSVALLAGYAVQVGNRSAEHLRAQVALAVEEETDRYRELRSAVEGVHAGTFTPSPPQDPTRPYVAGRVRGQRYALLTSFPFQASAVGQSDLIPPVVPVTLDGADPRGGREEIENPVHLLSGPLDLAFFVTFLLPLLALAISFDLLSREREGGTLALLLSQPVTLKRIVLVKVLTRWAVLFSLTAGAVAVAFLLLRAGFHLDRFLLWSGVMGLYLAFWTGLGGLVNATGGDSSRNAVALTFLWLFFAILLPSGVQITAGLLHPIPSRAEMVALERGEIQDVQGDAEAVLTRFYDDHAEIMVDGSMTEVDAQTRAFAVDQEVARRLAPLRERYREQLSAQQGLIRSMRWLSPSILAHEALLEVAGTGDARRDRFDDQVEAFHAEWLSFFTPRIVGELRLTPEELDRIPSWEFEDEKTLELARGLLPNLFGLLLFLGLVTVAALRLLGRGEGRAVA